MTAPSSSSGRRFAAFVPPVLTVVLLVIAGRWFSARWETAMAGAERPAITWSWLGVAFVALIAHATTACAIWCQLLRAVGAPLTWREAVDSFAPSLLARYVPGKIWAHSVRVALTRRAGVRMGLSTGALLWETLVGLGAAGMIAIAGLGARGDATAFRSAIGLAAGCVAAFAVVAVTARTDRGGALLARVGGTGPARDPSRLLPAFSTSLVGWLVYGVAHLALARALAPLGLTDLPLLLGALALAWAGGYLAVVMPAGLGVRDGILLLLLAPLLDPPRALLFVALSRLVQLAVDASITIGWLLRQSLRSARTPATAPPSA